MATRRAEIRWPLLTHPLGMALGIIVLLGVLRALVDIHDVFLAGFFALLVAVVFSFPVDLFSKIFSRGISVILTLIGAVGLVALLAGFAYPVVTRQIGPLLQELPQGLSKAEAWLSGRMGGPVAQLPQHKQVAEHVQARVGDIVGGVISHAVPVAFNVTEIFIAALLLLVLAAFLVNEPNVYRLAVRQLVPREHEPVYDETWKRLGHDLRHWVGGTIVSMVIMGVFAGAGLAIIGVDGWFVLGALTFAGTFVPYLGALSSAVPGLIVALAQSPTTFLEACGVYLAVHIVEGYLVQPLVMRRAVELKPAVLLFGQACLGAVFGIMGIVVATPLMVCARALIRYLWVERRLGKTPPPDHPSPIVPEGARAS